MSYGELEPITCRARIDGALSRSMLEARHPQVEAERRKYVERVCPKEAITSMRLARVFLFRHLPILPFSHDQLQILLRLAFCFF